MVLQCLKHQSVAVCRTFYGYLRESSRDISEDRKKNKENGVKIYADPSSSEGLGSCVDR